MAPAISSFPCSMITAALQISASSVSMWELIKIAMPRQRIWNISDQFTGLLRFLDYRDAVNRGVAFRRFIERRQDPHRRSLSRAIRTDEADYLARRERERNVIHRSSRAEVFFEMADFNLHSRPSS